MIELICEYCGKHVFKDASKYRFCSQSCYWQYLKENPPKKRQKTIKQNCVICGKEFEKWTCWPHVTCCSKKCGYEKRKRNPRKPKKLIEKICISCGNIFQSPWYRKQKFCSHKCYLKFKSKFVKHPDKQRFQDEKWLNKRNVIEINHKGICQLCGIKGAKDVHHKIPYSFTADDNIANLTLLCKSCHYHLHNIMTKVAYYGYYPTLDDTGENLVCLLEKKVA